MTKLPLYFNVCNFLLTYIIELDSYIMDRMIQKIDIPFYYKNVYMYKLSIPDSLTFHIENGMLIRFEKIELIKNCEIK